eukprot:CAMPEP_0194077120 /NCGR_PEP_ID=MMETSP0149-20130528/3778_1 /TAXON_ID=122233 /ORGANISM="Chaetoceros debilis, Strain MM31A-1" /LENGTH=498 /DNA_ID=CAMNT_0038758041 /DNA_START=45 /DNA_END=1541 /DNA_ORIENTATION=-
MGKGKSAGNWGHDRHADNFHKKLDKQREKDEILAQQEEEEVRPKKKSKTKLSVKGYHRAMILSHDTHEKKEERRVKLHMTKVRRQLDKLRTRLERWDEVQERADYKKAMIEAEKQRKKEEEEAVPGFKRKRSVRLGPETWKLRGPARPAQEVYDFDTRYVDPYIKAHKDALVKAQRSINAFHIFKDKFGKLEGGDDNDGEENQESADDKPSPLLIDTCRLYLAQSMQFALLGIEGRKFKTARETLLDIISLEGYGTLSPITNARCRLMRMYLDANRPGSARRLWEKLPSDYSSVWIRYSAALLEFVSWKVLGEEGSSEKSAMDLLVEAIRGNVYCAYYLSFHDTFHQVMEYTEEVDDAEDSTLEQAIEYCNSEQMGSWMGTEGAVEWVQSVVLHTLNDKSSGSGSSVGADNHGKDTDDASENNKNNILQRGDLDWETGLDQLERDFDEDKSNDAESVNSNDDSIDGNDEEEAEVDFLMFAGMFRTSMEMLSDAGKFTL